MIEKQACGLVMHFDKSVNRNIVLEKIQKNSCNVRGFPIEYQVLWHDSYEARGCCTTNDAGSSVERMSC